MAECPYQGKRKSNGMFPCQNPERFVFDYHAEPETSSPCQGDTVELCAAYQRAEKHKAWTEADELRARAEALEAEDAKWKAMAGRLAEAVMVADRYGYSHLEPIPAHYCKCSLCAALRDYEKMKEERGG